MHRSVLVRHVSPSARVTNIANRRALGLPGPGLRTGRIIPSAVDVAAPLVDGLANLAMHLPLAYEPVALPCSLMKCGDVVYRSTLDPALRREETGLDWRGVALLASVAAYLFLPPGPFSGFIDSYFLANGVRRNSRIVSKEDIIMGRKLATGGFGSVFMGELKESDGSTTPVVVKKAKEYGQAEVWMNERLMRIGGNHAAEFISAFEEIPPPLPIKKAAAASSPLDNAIWLVWKYEGDSTLFGLMEKKEFPYNVEELLFDRELKLPRGPRRKAVSIRLLMKQLLEALKACHNSGIVHRDVKPQNLIVSTVDSKIKLIDLGAAADLRVGINYVPKEYLLDPRYAPPQQYVMSTQTVRPPPAPVAAFLSPVLWNMEKPDRFDMYSCGVTLLQMAFPTLRTDNSIILFNKRDKYKYDLRAWRAYQEGKGAKDFAEGFELLDLDNGAGWELLCSLMAYKPNDRPSAAEALLQPLFQEGAEWSSGGLALPSSATSAIASATRSVGSVMATQQRILDEAIVTGAKDGQLTEAYLSETLGLEKAAPRPTRVASNTIAWWQERSEDQKKRVGGTLSLRRPGVRPTSAAEAKPSIRGAAAKQSALAAANGRNGKFVLPWGLGSKASAASQEVDEEKEVEIEEEEEEEKAVGVKPKFSLMSFISRK